MIVREKSVDTVRAEGERRSRRARIMDTVRAEGERRSRRARIMDFATER